MEQLEDLTRKVREIAMETGYFLKMESTRFRRERVEEKHAHDYVSYVDKEAERKIVEQLSLLLPEAGIIAEEGSGSFSRQPYCWVIDPLDGTSNFIHNNAPYCVSIALRNREEIVLGVVYEVCRDECFWSWKGGASYLNGRVIRVSDVGCLDQSFIALGFPYDSERFKPMALRIVDKLYGNVGGLRLQGAAAAELCYVAAGRFEARIEAFLSPWDIAAGTLILLNAGGKLTDFSGGDTFHLGREVLASNDLVHDALLEVVATR